MRTFLTEVVTYDIETEKIEVWAGPEIKEISLELAELYLEENGLGYCKIIGEKIANVDGEGDITYLDNSN